MGDDDEKRDAADACLSLQYKHNSLRGCVKYQRPELIRNDAILCAIETQFEILEAAFEQRIRKLAE